MAKKLTARQRAAHKRASYIKAEYYKNVDAIRYLERFGVTKNIKIPNKITKKSLTAIRRIYKETRANVKTYEGTSDYVDITTGEVFTKLPTKAQAVKEYRQEQKQQAEQFNPDEQFIGELKDKIMMLKPLRDSDKTDYNYNKNVIPKQEKVKQDFVNAIDNAIKQYGLDIVAQALANNDFMQRVGSMEEKYTYEIIEDITDGDDGLISLMDASAEAALSVL